MNGKIAFIGAGNMAEAVISGIVHQGILPKEQITVTNRSNADRLEEIGNTYQVRTSMDKEQVVREADMVLLATKPYDLEEMLTSIRSYIQPHQLIISVVAGISTDFISRLIGQETPVVRTMPNTSAAVGASATAIAAGKYAGAEHIRQVEAMFNTIGLTQVVEEADMHIVTGISGSGPAYIYYLVEAMENAAVEAGLDAETAHKLITQTVVGAGEMLKDSGEPASLLRKKITSAKGTTEAGVKSLERNDFAATIKDCVESARKRSVELGEEE